MQDQDGQNNNSTKLLVLPSRVCSCVASVGLSKNFTPSYTEVLPDQQLFLLFTATCLMNSNGQPFHLRSSKKWLSVKLNKQVVAKRGGEIITH